MAPNLIGSTFILAETAIATNDAPKKKPANNMLATGPLATTPKGSPKPLHAKKSNKSQPPIAQSPPAVAPALPAVSSVKPAAEPTVTATTKAQEPLEPYQKQIVWHNVGLFVILHAGCFYGLYLLIFDFQPIDLFLTLLMMHLGGIGITGGVHRLWSHKSYKAKLPLRIFLMLCQSFAFQNSIWEWCRDHRVHHKFTDTHADPHNSRRGFFFSHMGWLMCKKHPDVRAKGKQIDMSDLEADPVVAFQKKYFFIVMPLCIFVVAGLLPYMFLGVSASHAFFILVMFRYTVGLHATWLVNSAAHFYGMKPYETAISAVNTKLVANLSMGEGWHNYHHVFPWDYKAAELSMYRYNTTCAFIDLMAYLGQAYDLKSVTPEMVFKRLRRTGDGSHAAALKDSNNNPQEITSELVAQLDHEQDNNTIWGWDDQDISESDRHAANIIAKKDD